MRRLILLLFVCCASCGQFDAGTYTDQAFVEYLEEFEAEYDMNLKNYPIHFQDLVGDRIGQCNYPEIKIDPKKWAAMYNGKRRATIFHELGHCVLGLPHDEEWIVDSMGQVVPRSLMYPTLREELAYERNWQYYKDQLRRR